ncbi:MAG: GNAT family N-acetyltransferase [Pseudomonadota bacterium]
MGEPARTDSDARIEVHTERLTLVALDRELVRLQVEDRRAFFQTLGASFEAAWPPVSTDEPKLAEKLELLERAPEDIGWRGWVVLMAVTPGAPMRAVGVGGFHGPPDARGRVEVGYAMSPSFREQGLATEAVEALVGWAFAQGGVSFIQARTLEHLAASRRVLEKTGFTQAGPVDEAGMITYRLEHG